jgi:hypothetical protein
MGRGVGQGLWIVWIQYGDKGGKGPIRYDLLLAL